MKQSMASILTGGRPPSRRTRDRPGLPPDDYGVPLGPDDVAFRDEVRDFLDRELTADIVDIGRRTEPERGRATPGVATTPPPRRARGHQLARRTRRCGAGVVQQLVFNAELARHRAPDPINRSAINQLGPTIIQWGDDDSGPTTCRGSCVATTSGARASRARCRERPRCPCGTRAVVGDGGFVVTGQKIWTSKAQYADWIYILARTDPDAPKHEGISFLLVELRSPGIEVRPIRQITGAAEFNEVFFDEVPVPRANLVGPLHGGWRGRQTRPWGTSESGRAGPTGSNAGSPSCSVSPPTPRPTDARMDDPLVARPHRPLRRPGRGLASDRRAGHGGRRPRGGSGPRGVRGQAPDLGGRPGHGRLRPRPRRSRGRAAARVCGRWPRAATWR